MPAKDTEKDKKGKPPARPARPPQSPPPRPRREGDEEEYRQCTPAHRGFAGGWSPGGADADYDDDSWGDRR